MGGRNDFGVLRSDFLSDDRAHAAADAYAAKGWADPNMAVAMVAGHVAMLGLHAMLHTDDGVLPGDGVAFFHAATLVPRPAAREIVTVLTEAKLLRKTEHGLYLVGFADCYRQIIDARATDRKRKAEKRAEARGVGLPRVDAENEPVAAMSDGHPTDIRPTSTGVPTDVPRPSAGCPTVPYRTVPYRNGTGRDGTDPAVPFSAGTAESPPVVESPREADSNATTAGGGSASPPGTASANGRSAEPPADLVASARAVIAVVRSKSKHVPLETRVAAQRIGDRLKARTATEAELREFIAANYGDTACRVAALHPPESIGKRASVGGAS